MTDLGAFVSLLFDATGSAAAVYVLLAVMVSVLTLSSSVRHVRGLKALESLRSEGTASDARRGAERDALLKAAMARGVKPLAGFSGWLVQMVFGVLLLLMTVGFGATAQLSGFGIRVAAPRYLDTDSALSRAVVSGGGELRFAGVDLLGSVATSRSLMSVLFVVAVGLCAAVSRALTAKAYDGKWWPSDVPVWWLAVTIAAVFVPSAVLLYGLISMGFGLVLHAVLKPQPLGPVPQSSTPLSWPGPKFYSGPPKPFEGSGLPPTWPPRPTGGVRVPRRPRPPSGGQSAELPVPVVAE
jgi:hypothetical protein